jgi:hypothetical protein
LVSLDSQPALSGLDECLVDQLTQLVVCRRGPECQTGAPKFGLDITRFVFANVDDWPRSLNILDRGVIVAIRL